MSADSPTKTVRNVVGKLVLPGQVVDRSIIDSVAGFIQDVVPHVSPFEIFPHGRTVTYLIVLRLFFFFLTFVRLLFQGYNNVLNADSREKILWTQFELVEPDEFPVRLAGDESFMSGVSPILLVLGYGFGVQVLEYHLYIVNILVLYYPDATRGVLKKYLWIYSKLAVYY